MPTSSLSQAVAQDGFVAGYWRNWLNTSDSTPAAGWISLFAFRDNDGAERFARESRAFFDAVGVSMSAVPDVAWGATASTAHGPRGTSYAVVAVRDGVIVEVAAGGAGITLAQVKRLAKEQLARV